MTYTCIGSFTTTKGVKYCFGDEISATDYIALDYKDRKYFEENNPNQWMTTKEVISNYSSMFG